MENLRPIDRIRRNDFLFQIQPDGIKILSEFRAIVEKVAYIFDIFFANQTKCTLRVRKPGHTSIETKISHDFHLYM